MARRFPARKQRRRTFIRQWREDKGLTLSQLAERLEMSEPQLSKIETGKQPYSQDFLEACAEALGTDPASLLMRDPSSHNGIWSVWEQAKPGEREMIYNIARTITKTGT